MAKKKSAGTQSSGGASVRASRSPAAPKARENAGPTGKPAKPSAFVDTRFNSNRNYEVFWGETKEKRAFENHHASTQTSPSQFGGEA